jgi:hypothetical protein
MTSVTRHPATRSFAVPLALAALAALALPAGANQINTGGSTGAYETSFCPVLAQQLKLAQFDYRCTPSAGTARTWSACSPTRGSSATANSTGSRSRAGR